MGGWIIKVNVTKSSYYINNIMKAIKDLYPDTDERSERNGRSVREFNAPREDPIIYPGKRPPHL